MTEKRFWYDFEDCNGQKIVDFKEDKEYPLETIGEFRKIEDLLNEQHEQIERLKRNFKALDELKCEIAEENEQLKKENQELKNYLLHMGYKTIYHDEHISLEQIKIKKMKIRNGLLDGWIE